MRASLSQADSLKSYGSAAMQSLMLSACLCGGTSVAAQELTLAYGVNFVSNYVSFGLTQTQDRPAVQPWVEANYGLFYAGVSGSNVRFAGVNDVEFDIYAGIQPQVGRVVFDLGYIHYAYRDDPREFGDAFLGVAVGLDNGLSLASKFYYETRSDDRWLYTQFAFEDLPWNLVLSGGFGTDMGSSLFPDQLYAADLGLTRGLGDYTEVDLRAYHSSEEGNKILVELSFFNGKRLGGSKGR